MKKLFLALLLITNFSLFSQKLEPKSSLNNTKAPYSESAKFQEEEVIPNEILGPIAPINKDYASYKSYSIDVILPAGLAKSFDFKKLPFDENKIIKKLAIQGLEKKDINADFRIVYTIKRFELETSDKIVKTVQRLPAYHLGIESQIECFDNKKKLIYKHLNGPVVNMHVTPAEWTYDNFVGRFISNDFSNLCDDFKSIYLHSPLLSNPKVGTADKKRKSKSTFNVDELKSNSEKLKAILKGSHTEWPAAFAEQKIYWAALKAFNDESDKDLSENVIAAANTNLALIDLLSGDEAAAKSYLEIIKKNEPRFMGSGDYSPFIEKSIIAINDFKKKEQSNPVIFQEENEVPDYLRKGFLLYQEEGEVEFSGGKKYKGNIYMMNDEPEMVDWVLKTTGKGLGATLSSLEAANLQILVFADNSEKPTFKSTLKNLVSFTDTKGNVFKAAKLGSVMDAGAGNKHWGLIKESDSHKGIKLYQEVFPQFGYIFGKGENDTFFKVPNTKRRSSIVEFFGCDELSKSVNAGTYDSASNLITKKIFEDFKNLCK